MLLFEWHAHKTKKKTNSNRTQSIIVHVLPGLLLNLCSFMVHLGHRAPSSSATVSCREQWISSCLLPLSKPLFADQRSVRLPLMLTIFWRHWRPAKASWKLRPDTTGECECGGPKCLFAYTAFRSLTGGWKYDAMLQIVLRYFQSYRRIFHSFVVAYLHWYTFLTPRTGDSKLAIITWISNVLDCIRVPCLESKSTVNAFGFNANVTVNVFNLCIT